MATIEERKCLRCGKPLPPLKLGVVIASGSDSCRWRQPRPVTWSVPDTIEEWAVELSRIPDPFD
jgi:hypothetical protein